MYLLLSGEGSGDIGVCDSSAQRCDLPEFKAGPMAWIIDQLLETYQGYEFSHLDNASVSYVSEGYLAGNKAGRLKKSISLPGKKKPVETRYFYENARALAIAAKAKAIEVDDKVIAILFRDSDGTASAGRGIWAHKRNSMIEGFKAEAFSLGVAMVPKPKSEVWLLCATKENPYQHCESLESESGNDKSANPLKEQLADALDGKDATVDINTLLENRTIDVNKIDMPSFNQFKIDLKLTVKAALSKDDNKGNSHEY